MSKPEAIRHLREALRLARLPLPKDALDAWEKDAQGNFTAVSSAFCLGYVTACIKDALYELGEKAE